MQDELDGLVSASETTPEFNSRIVFTLRIIVVAMMLGVTTLGVLFAVLNPARNVPGAPAISFGQMAVFMLIPFVLISLIAFVLIPPMLFKQARRQVIAKSWKPSAGRGRRGNFARNESEYMVLTFQTATIIQAALCEGTAFFALIMAWLSQALWPAAVTLVMLGLIASRFPTLSRLEDWLQVQLGLLEEEKQETF